VRSCGAAVEGTAVTSLALVSGAGGGRTMVVASDEGAGEFVAETGLAAGGAPPDSPHAAVAIETSTAAARCQPPVARNMRRYDTARSGHWCAGDEDEVD